MLGASVVGDGATVIQRVSDLAAAERGDLTFFADPRHRSTAAASAGSVMIVRENDIAINDSVKLVHSAPHAAFARSLEILFPNPAVVAGASSKSDVHPSADVALARIDAFVSVGARSRIGRGSHIHVGASVGDDVVVGDDCIIHPGARLYAGVRLGDRCIVHSGAVIGADGFGFQPSANGWLKVAQVGSVVIGNDVEIGANTAIDRGAIEDTVIGNGVKIDNLVQIAHNCRIGDHTAIAGCAGLAGSSIVGARCMIGGAAMIVGHLSICDDVVISGGSLVASSITRPGRYTSVFPITEHRTWMKIAAGLRRSGK
jgi:UDP-3-O-[3-hydroxymyristoyl] glucosamine N-acyltransferase